MGECFGLSVKTSSKFMFIVKMLVYAFLYGLFIINIIDLTIKVFAWYHIFLIMLYFFPFIIVCLILGFDDWELLVGLGLLASLMNDLFYGVIGNILFHTNYDLSEWFMNQLGFNDGKYLFTFMGGLFTLKVTSLIMGLSIYARIMLVYAVLYKWWKE
jgi:hypothetical protein